MSETCSSYRDLVRLITTLFYLDENGTCYKSSQHFGNIVCDINWPIYLPSQFNSYPSLESRSENNGHGFRIMSREFVSGNRN